MKYIGVLKIIGHTERTKSSVRPPEKIYKTI